jgi:hypothetical protein
MERLSAIWPRMAAKSPRDPAGFGADEGILNPSC